MTLQLIAISPQDGWGFYQDLSDGKFYRIRPPYEITDEEVAERYARRAVTRAGYTSVQQEFESRDPLVEYMNTQLAAHRPAIDKPDFEIIADLQAVVTISLLKASRDTVANYVDRAERLRAEGKLACGPRVVRSFLAIAKNPNLTDDLRNRLNSLAIYAQGTPAPEKTIVDVLSARPA